MFRVLALKIKDFVFVCTKIRGRARVSMQHVYSFVLLTRPRMGWLMLSSTKNAVYCAVAFVSRIQNIRLFHRECRFIILI